MTHRLSAVLLGVMAMVSATPTRAQVPAGPHFTFTVPVRLTNLPPEVQQYLVSCAVRAGPAAPIMGGGASLGAISGGSLNADVVVNVTANALADPALATYYQCEVALSGPKPPGSPPGGDLIIQYLGPSLTRFPLLAGAPFRQLTAGAIPR